MYKKQDYTHFYLELDNGHIWAHRGECRTYHLDLTPFLPLTEENSNLLNMIIPDKKDIIARISEKLKIWDEIKNVRYVDSCYCITEWGEII